MEKRIFFLLMMLSLASLQGCLDEEIPDLSYNILDDETVSFFELESVDFFSVSNSRSDVEVTFSSIYDQLSENQQNNIDGIKVEGGGLDIQFDTNRNFFVDANRKKGANICYSLYFIAATGDLTEPTVICVDVE